MTDDAARLIDEWGVEVQAESHSPREWERHVAGDCPICTKARVAVEGIKP